MNATTNTAPAFFLTADNDGDTLLAGGTSYGMGYRPRLLTRAEAWQIAQKWLNEGTARGEVHVWKGGSVVAILRMVDGRICKFNKSTGFAPVGA